jgi:hypothetical protein
MTTFTLQAAGSGGSGGIIGLAIGILIVVGLIAAFVLGSRRKEKEPLPIATEPGPPSGAPGPHSDPGSWSTPASTPGEAPQGEGSPRRD